MLAYDAASINHEQPPPALVSLVRSADLIVSSDMPRAVASATLLAGDRGIESKALFREAPLETPELPLPSLRGMRLPVLGWGLLLGALWLRASRRGLPPPGVDAAVLARADAAAAWLADAAVGRTFVVVVTHATFRTLLAAALVRRGWQPSAKRPFREWSAWHLH